MTAHVDLILHVLIAVPGVIVACCAFAAAWATMRRLRILHIEINSRMTELVAATRLGGLADGRAQGVAEERAREERP